jgi:hypothetical protein
LSKISSCVPTAPAIRYNSLFYGKMLPTVYLHIFTHHNASLWLRFTHEHPSSNYTEEHCFRPAV